MTIPSQLPTTSYKSLIVGSAQNCGRYEWHSFQHAWPARLLLLIGSRHCQFQFAQRITRRTELPDALVEFMQGSGPCLLEVMTDTAEVLYPVVRPGMSYAEMVLGPYIREIPAGHKPIAPAGA